MLGAEATKVHTDELVAARDASVGAELVELHAVARLAVDPTDSAAILGLKVAKAASFKAAERLTRAQNVVLALICNCGRCKETSHAAAQ